jgi:Acetyltransferase (GNAT) domain
MVNKDFYIQNYPPSVPLFHKPFWLDATAGKDLWDVALVMKDGKILASMPFTYSSAKRNEISLPLLTQFLGPHITVAEQGKLYKRYSAEVQALEELLEQIPSVKSFYQQWSYRYENWLPFYWRGFKQTTRYTYIIPSTVTQQQIWDNFKDSVRTDTRKAEKRVTIDKAFDVALLYTLIEKVFSKQGGKPPYSREFLSQLSEVLKREHCAEIFFARDIDDPDVVHAGGLFVWDEFTMYYLASGLNTDLKNSGAMTLILWHAIQLANSLGKSFDFEGSMLPKVEPFFRNFGAERKMYHAVYKESFGSSALKLLKSGFKEIWKDGKAKNS